MPAPAAASLAQARCDAVMKEYRAEAGKRPSIRRAPTERRSIRRDPPPQPLGLAPTDDALQLRLAEELQFARRMIEAMGDTLSADPQLIMRHMVSLQSIDIVGQILGHVADVVRSNDPNSAVDRIGMCELKARLQRQSIA